MNIRRLLCIAIPLILASCLMPSAYGQDPAATKDLLVLSSDLAKRITPQSGAEAQVSALPSRAPAAPGLVITIQPGKAGYPGINLKPDGAKPWDLSAFGHVEATVVNTSDKTALFALRVDNGGDWRDNPWNTEQASLKPGERATITVIFGHQYGHKPGYALKPNDVVNILMFTGKADAPMAFRVESLVAGGPAGEKPPVDPASIRIKPVNRAILGAGVKIDPVAQIDSKGGVKAAIDGDALRIEFPSAKVQQSVALKPPAGRWDLRDATEVRVKLKNAGTTPLTPTVQLTSNGGPTDSVSAAVLPAGAETEIVIPFAAAVPFNGVPVTKAGFFGAKKGTGTNFASDAVSTINVAAKHDGPATLLVESITTAAPPAELPAWLGNRPPVEGDWAKTFDDNFDGPTIDAAKWNIYGPNYWDKATHWSKDNLLFGGGVAKLHFEKKRGFHNDDPNPKDLQNLSKQKESPYACGFLETYGKFVQRYGYFEARVKLPTAPGLWPTFWLMPDRGPAAGAHDKRQDTANGGMEFDIMEHLTRWGPNRYNIALHWNGYGKEHKSIGSPSNYIQADKDGFITPGLLWTPGSAVFYCNGKELWRWEDPQVGNIPSSILIEMTTGGWDNNAVDDAQLPADYLIDYVRVWQRKDLASDADKIKPAPAGK
jgi:beta-glucanase (GH16 family)